MPTTHLQLSFKKLMQTKNRVSKGNDILKLLDNEYKFKFKGPKND